VTRPGSARLAATAVMVMLLVPALGAGCAGHAATTRQAPRTQPVAQERQPAWRAIDRNALAASLGWGQVSRGNTAARRIALTFDAGSSAQYAPPILDALKSAGLHCTFFITGQFADANPSIMARLAAEGHELGNHSYSHPRFTQLPPAEVTSQLDRTEAAVERTTGLSTKPYFRFPYGAGSNALVQQVNGMGYIGVLWTFDTLDSIEGTTPEAIRSRVSERAVPGAIVLMHLGSPQEAQALPTVMRDLEASGYELVTLSEVLSR
jgi:peptidoglycan-N-acetylglucosamine deacetylase